MLGEGLRAGLAHLGVSHRTVAYIEREAYAASVLVARMEEGSLDEAPVWPDLLTFDGRAWRGAVDCIVAGFPCQDLSLAGRRAGLDGSRSGLFFDILDIADACGAGELVLENVAGIASATASVVDEAEGALDERAAARVLGELADRGWNAEWLTLSASDVGASHGRSRWFCWAWRMADSECVERRALSVSGGGGQQGHDRGRAEAHGRAGIANALLGDTPRERCGEAGPCGGTGVPGTGVSGAELADATGHGRQQGRSDVAECGCAVAHTSSPRQQRPELGTTRDGHRGGGQETHGPTSQLRGLFAPGPADPRWGAILREYPELAPALEPAFRGVVNGLDFDMGDSRAARLKCVGNGVVAIQAAAAFVMLARRSGFMSRANQPATNPVAELESA